MNFNLLPAAQSELDENLVIGLIDSMMTKVRSPLHITA